jgi:hypothetical protein
MASPTDVMNGGNFRDVTEVSLGEEELPAGPRLLALADQLRRLEPSRRDPHAYFQTKSDLVDGCAGCRARSTIGRGYLCSFCQTTSKLQTLPVMRTRTVPSRSILPLATTSLASPPCTAAARITNSPCNPIVPSKWEWWPRRLVNSARPCAATSGPPMSFPHRAFTGGAGVDETNAYVPSNAVVAVESAWVCAPAAATKLKIPPIASHPILFVI